MARRIVMLLLVAGAYYATGRLALLMAIPPGYATAVWPAAGIALVAATILGGWACLAVAIASFALNVGTTFDGSSREAIARSLAMTALIGMGAGLQAAVGAGLFRRAIGYPTALDRERDVALLFAVGPTSCLLNASVSIAALAVFGRVPASDLAVNWGTWWVGDSIGVLVFTPVLLSLFGRPRDAWRPRITIVALPLMLGFLAATVFFIRASGWEQAEHDAAFASRAQFLASALRRRIGEYVDAVQSVASFFQAEEHVTRQQFRDFAGELRTRYPGIQALEWCPRVSATERAEVEAAVARDGVTDFRIVERDERGRLVPAARRDAYVPVLYAEPLDGNERALGFDLASDAERRDGIARADARGTAVVSPLRLVQETAYQTGVLVLVRVRAGSETSGFAVGVLRAGDVVDEALAGLDRADTRVRLSAVAPGGERLLHQDEALPASSPIVSDTSFQVADQTWQVRFAASPRYVAANRTWQAWVVLAGGLVSVAFLGSLLLILTGRQARVIQSEARKVAVLDSAFDAVVSTDLAGAVVEFNSAAERMFGFRRDQIVGQPIVDHIIPQSYRERHVAGMKRYRETGDGPVIGRIVQLAALRADGTEFPIEIAITRVAGQPLLTAYIRDITERKQAEREREQLLGELRGAVEARDEFLAIAGHELRTPLTALQLQVQMLRNRVAADPLAVKVRSIERQTERLGRLIDGILDVVRLTTGRFELVREEVELLSVAREVAERFEPQAELARCRVTVVGQAPVVGVWDRLRLEQVISNLIANSIKYAPGTTIEVNVQRSERAARLSVRDRGPGIANADVERIFGRFERAVSPRHFGGLGLGLYVSRQIVELHGGSLSVESELGAGSTFSIVMPI